MRTVIVTADDYGLTRGVSESILAAATAGTLTQVSIMANGADFTRAAAALTSVPALSKAVHLNLTEGHPVLPAETVPHLINAVGTFRHSFASLLLLSLFLHGAKRRALIDEIQRECAAQVARVAKAFPTDSLSLNSHEHVHLIPLVFSAVLAVQGERVISLRLIREPFSLRPFSRTTMRHLCSLNLLKHMLLNALSRCAYTRMRTAYLAYPDAFIGVLHTGAVEFASIEALSKKIPQQARTIEILVHPGLALPGEEQLLRSSSRAWHYSPWRVREAEVLKSRTFARLLSQLRT